MLCLSLHSHPHLAEGPASKGIPINKQLMAQLLGSPLDQHLVGSHPHPKTWTLEVNSTVPTTGLNFSV